MSSILDKISSPAPMKELSSSSSTSTLIEKRSFFLRTSSIQKIKCSATYPFRIAGTKLSKDAIKQLFETLIIKARIISHKASIDLLIGTIKLFGVLVSLWIGAPTKDICDNNSNKTETLLSFQERLLEKIHKLQKHKQRFELKTKDLSSSLSTTSSSTTPLSTTNNKLKLTKSSILSSESHPNDSSLKQIINNCETKTSPLATVTTTVCSNNNNNQDDDLKKPKKDFLLALLVYSSAMFIYLQLILLTLALNTTQCIPPGLLFLIISLVVIAIILFKVFLIEKSEIKVNGLGGKQMRKSDKSDSEESSSSTSSGTSRQTRSKSRKTLIKHLSSKTLSKIKIL